MSDSVEVDAEVLEQLVEFAETHGTEYGHERVYYAVRDGKEALGYDDPEPYMPKKDSWGSDDE